MGIRVQEIVPDARLATSVPHYFHELVTLWYELQAEVRLY